MRIYATSKRTRILLTGAWVVLCATALVHPVRDWSYAAMVAFAAATQLATLWGDYWDLSPHAFVEVTLFMTKVFNPADLVSAEHVREQGFKGYLLRKSIKLTVKNRNRSVYARPGASTIAFLRYLQEHAPHANICYPDS